MHLLFQWWADFLIAVCGTFGLSVSSTTYNRNDTECSQLLINMLCTKRYLTIMGMHNASIRWSSTIYHHRSVRHWAAPTGIRERTLSSISSRIKTWRFRKLQNELHSAFQYCKNYWAWVRRSLQRLIEIEYVGRCKFFLRFGEKKLSCMRIHV